MTSPRPALAAFIALIVSVPTGVVAYDVEVNMDTEFRAYEIRSPTSTVFWARRRLVDTVGLRYIQQLSEKGNNSVGPRLQAHVNLRLFEEFGETCLVAADDVCFAVTDPAERGSYQPLARDAQVEAPLAYLEASDLALGMRFRVGRQLYWDRIGFARFDGAGVGADPWFWLHLEVFGGAFVTNNSIGGSDAFNPQGVARLKLSDNEKAAAPFVASPVNMWVVGAAIDAGTVKLVRFGLSFRELWESDGVAQLRAGVGALSQPIDPLYLHADAVWDLLDFALADAQVAADLRLEPMTWHLSGQRHVPRFDLGTIWAYFDVAPVWEEKLGATWNVTENFQVGGAFCGRHTEMDNSYDHDLGLEGNTAVRIGALKLGFSGFGWSGDLGPVWGANLDGARPLASWLILEGRLSYWRIDNVLRPEMRGQSLSETVSVSARVTETTILTAELSHAYSGVVGNRFWVYALLHLGAWR